MAPSDFQADQPEEIQQEPLLRALAASFGIATEFWDWKGRHTLVRNESLVAVLKALDIDASNTETAERALTEIDRRAWTRLLPPVVVVEQGQNKTFGVHIFSGAPAEVAVRLEDGGTWPLGQVSNEVPDREFDGQWYGEATFQVPENLPLGYHRLSIHSGDREAESQLIVTPRFLGFPSRMGDRRVWGYATQFYSVRSERSWGIGDLADLADLATWAGTQHNASYVLVNPVHASNPVAPLEPSPYLPTSRRYVNPIYIHVEDIPEYATLSQADRLRIEALRADLLAGDDPNRLDRDSSWRARIEALKLVFAAGLRPARQMAFDDFRRREGRTLSHFSTWSALVAEHGPHWLEWPAELQRPASPEVAAFALENADTVTFYSWMQWIVDTQLAEAQLAAENAGMAIGIINDLAVGISADGADAWSLADVFAQGVHVGAPPDSFNQTGQDWGQPPWRPDRLADLAYAPFRNMVSGILRHSGGVRIDHILGLFRLWWVPIDQPASAGTYVRYDHEALVGILALEAGRAGALVVGEDLGVVEPWVRDYLRQRGILGTSILWFESGENGGPLPADQWREYCMASVTTHDLPPTAGYLALDHVKLRHELGLLTVPVEEELETARHEQRAWLDEIRARGLLAPDEADVEQVVLALHRYVLQTPSRVLNVSLVDAVGDRRTQNQPGTTDEYPNWRVPLSGEDGRPMTLEDVYASDRATRLAAVMNGWTLPGQG